MASGLSVREALAAGMARTYNAGMMDAIVPSVERIQAAAQELLDF